LSWLGILLGALCAANIPAIRINRIELKPIPGSALIESILLMQALDQARDHTPPGCTSTELMHALRIRYQILSSLLETLTDFGMVANTQWQGQDRWVLACNPETKRLGPLFDYLSIDRDSLKLINQPTLTRVITELVAHDANPILADVLLHHDNKVCKPLQSGKHSGTAETHHA